MLRSETKPLFLVAPGGQGKLMLRARARRMGFVVMMLAAIIAVPFILLVGPLVF